PASRRRESKRLAPPCALEPVLRALGAPAGELLPFHSSGDGARHVGTRPAASRLLDPSAVHGTRRRSASAAPARGCCQEKKRLARSAPTGSKAGARRRSP